MLEELKELEVAMEEFKRKYEAVKRKAEVKQGVRNDGVKVGNKVLITTGEHKGKIFTVKFCKTGCATTVIDVEELPLNEDFFHFERGEYKVVDDFASQRTNQGTNEVEALECLILSANEGRKKLIQQARLLVANRELNIEVDNVAYVFHRFRVNEEKRTVVALYRRLFSDKVEALGIAKCMPGDVFNADISKLIALYKAEKKDIPLRFTHAVQPTEVCVGAIVKFLNGRIAEVIDNKYIKDINEDATYAVESFKKVTIINDTYAKY